MSGPMINSPIRFGRPGLFGPQPTQPQQPAAAPSMAPAWGSARIDPDGVRRPAVNFLDSTAGGGGMMPGYGADFGAMPDAMPQTPGMFIQPPSFGGGGGSGAARNPHGQGADPFDPRSKFDAGAGKFYAEGGTIVGPGGPRDDMIPALVNGIEPIAVSNGEELTDAVTRDYWGKKTFLDLKKKAHEAMAEIPDPKPVMKQGMVPGFADGGTVNPWLEMLPGRMQDTAAADARFSEDVQSQLSEAARVFATPDPAPGPGTMFARNYQPSVPVDPMTEGWRSDVEQRAQAALALPSVPTGAPVFDRPDPDALASYRARNAGHRYNDMMQIGVPQAPVDTSWLDAGRAAAPAPAPVAAARPMDIPGQLNDGHFLAPWEKDAQARPARAPQQFPGMNRTQSRRFAASPQGQKIIAGQAEREIDRGREDALNTTRAQQDAEDRRLRMAEFQQKSDYYKKQAAAGDVEAQFRQAQFNLDLSKWQADQSEKGKPVQISNVPVPGSSMVVPFAGKNQVAPAFDTKGTPEMTPEEAEKRGLEIDSVTGGKIRWKQKDAPKVFQDKMDPDKWWKIENGVPIEVKPGAAAGATAPAKAGTPTGAAAENSVAHNGKTYTFPNAEAAKKYKEHYNIK